jgi:hypothetical protein
MIKFFRHIRQRLLTENKFSKYSLYAIGEIVLVVIGILIAVQINTWNNQHQDALLEIKILKEIESNLKQDLDEIYEDINLMDTINLASENLRKYLKRNDSPNDSFSRSAGALRIIPHFDANKSGYGLLESKGIGIVSNDSLRNAISVHYERLYPYYRRYEDERIEFHSAHSEPILLKYFTMYIDGENSIFPFFTITPPDYNKLKLDDDFLKLTHAVSLENNAVLIRAKRIERSILYLLSQISEELGKLEK